MREPTVAPKERINIVYRPATEGEPEVELPLKLLLLGAFSELAEQGNLDEQAPVMLDKDNFNAVLKAQKVGLSVQVKNCLPEAKDPLLDVVLNFEAIRDFDPDRVALMVPELKRLLAMREALVTLKSVLGNQPQFRRWLTRIVRDPKASEAFIAAGASHE